MVTIGWNLSTVHGWGIFGLNLALCWADDAALQLRVAAPWLEEYTRVDALRRARLGPVFERSRELIDTLAKHPHSVIRMPGTLLTPMGNGLSPLGDGRRLRPDRSVGVLFLEDTQIPAPALETAAQMDCIVAGSSWNEQVLRARGLTNVCTILQGVDPSLFHPGPRTGWWGDRFLIFSGGKLEYRKGQDLVLRAFRVFAQRHREAVLVTAWHSPFADHARSLAASGEVAPVTFAADGRVDVRAWATASGIAAEQIIDLGTVPNQEMPRILREMDLAVFPNRAEGGTNLVAMEAMACGVPTILSANTGHLDLMADPQRCWRLECQRVVAPVAGFAVSTEGWGESDLDELIAAMESAWADRDAARARGLSGAQWMKTLSWTAQSQQLKERVNA